MFGVLLTLVLLHARFSTDSTYPKNDLYYHDVTGLLDDLAKARLSRIRSHEVERTFATALFVFDSHGMFLLLHD
jgi:hypothetical protein